jgi:hypothetical protein
MQIAINKDNQRITADSANHQDSYVCPLCKKPVVLKVKSTKINYFEHAKRTRCKNKDFEDSSIKATSTTIEKIIKNHDSFFNSPEKVEYLLTNYQIPSDILDQYFNLLNWKQVKIHQKNLEEWFIEKYAEKLVDFEPIPATNNNIKIYLKDLKFIPALFIHDYGYSYSVGLVNMTEKIYDKKVNILLPNPIEFLKGRLVYSHPHVLKRRTMLGLIFIKKTRVHILINPSRYYGEFFFKDDFITPPYQTLFTVLKNNGLERRKNRSDAFNLFLKENKYI